MTKMGGADLDVSSVHWSLRPEKSLLYQCTTPILRGGAQQKLTSILATLLYISKQLQLSILFFLLPLFTRFQVVHLANINDEVHKICLKTVEITAVFKHPQDQYLRLISIDCPKG